MLPWKRMNEMCHLLLHCQRYSLAPSGLAGVSNSHLTASGSTLMMWRPEWQPLPHSRWQA